MLNWLSNRYAGRECYNIQVNGLISSNDGLPVRGRQVELSCTGHSNYTTTTNNNGAYAFNSQDVYYCNPTQGCDIDCIIYSFNSTPTTTSFSFDPSPYGSEGEDCSSPVTINPSINFGFNSNIGFSGKS